MVCLRDEVAGLVLNRLTDASDIIRCSVVCRTWGRLIMRTQLKAIEMWYREDHGDGEEAQAQLRWLQGLQNDGCFKNLQQAVLLQHPGRGGPEDLSTLSQGFIVMAGCWSLRTAVISGPFSMSHAVALLPKCLVELELWPISLPGTTVLLSQFQRYTNLQKLKVAVGEDLPMEDDDYFPRVDELLVDTALPALELLSVQDTLICKVAAGHSFAELLPSVRHACLNVCANLGGLVLAQSLMVSHMVSKLELSLIDSDGPDTTLRVLKCSGLEQLILKAPVSGPDVSLQLCKAGVRFECSNVHKVSCAHAPASIHQAAVFQ